MKLVQILLWIFKYLSRFSYRAHKFLYFFEVGMRHGYPLCCIAHFCWNAADPKFKKIGLRGEARGPATERGAVYDPADKVYVPCWFHLHIRRSPNWQAYNDDSPSFYPLHPRLFYMKPQFNKRRK